MTCTCSHQLQPHDRIEDVCPVYGMPLAEWESYGAIPEEDNDDC